MKLKNVSRRKRSTETAGYLGALLKRKKLLDNSILNYFDELAAVRNSLTMSGILRIFGDVDSELFLLSESSPSAERAATWATQSTAKYQKGYSKTS
jgi:hypothetical protein